MSTCVTIGRRMFPAVPIITTGHRRGLKVNNKTTTLQVFGVIFFGLGRSILCCSSGVCDFGKVSEVSAETSGLGNRFQPRSNYRVSDQVRVLSGFLLEYRFPPRVSGRSGRKSLAFSDCVGRCPHSRSSAVIPRCRQVASFGMYRRMSVELCFVDFCPSIPISCEIVRPIISSYFHSPDGDSLDKYLSLGYPVGDVAGGICKNCPSEDRRNCGRQIRFVQWLRLFSRDIIRCLLVGISSIVRVF